MGNGCVASSIRSVVVTVYDSLCGSLLSTYISCLEAPRVDQCIFFIFFNTNLWLFFFYKCGAEEFNLRNHEIFFLLFVLCF